MSICKLCKREIDEKEWLCEDCAVLWSRLPETTRQTIIAKIDVKNNNGSVIGVDQTIEGIVKQEINLIIGEKKSKWKGSSIFLNCDRHDPVEGFHEDLRKHIGSGSKPRVHAYILPASSNDGAELFLQRLRKVEFGKVMKGTPAEPFSNNWGKDHLIQDRALNRLKGQLIRGLKVEDSSPYHSYPEIHFVPELTRLANGFDYLFIGHDVLGGEWQLKTEELLRKYLIELAMIENLKARLLMFFMVYERQETFLSRMFKPKSCAEKITGLIEGIGMNDRITLCTLEPLKCIDWAEMNMFVDNSDEHGIPGALKTEIKNLYQNQSCCVPLQRIVDVMERYEKYT